MRERERGLESFGREVLDYSFAKGNGLYHWTIVLKVMDHSSQINGLYSEKAMDHSLGL